jgi:hypothetical protein
VLGISSTRSISVTSLVLAIRAARLALRSALATSSVARKASALSGTAMTKNNKARYWPIVSGQNRAPSRRQRAVAASALGRIAQGFGLRRQRVDPFHWVAPIFFLPICAL